MFHPNILIADLAADGTTAKGFINLRQTTFKARMGNSHLVNAMSVRDLPGVMKDKYGNPQTGVTNPKTQISNMLYMPDLSLNLFRLTK